MAVLAQRLQIRRIILAAFVQRDNVIDFLSTGEVTLSLAHDAERIGAQPAQATRDTLATTEPLN
jgi:hypothetical protein